MVRQIFGTMSFRVKIPIESIAKIMERASTISGTQIYVQITDNKTSKDMDRFIGKYKAKDKETTNAKGKISLILSIQVQKK